MKKRIITLITLCCIFMVQFSFAQHNYSEVLQKSMFFYEAQRAGELPSTNRINWRGDACVNDGSDVGADLSKGWFDAGDHVKFNFPMAWSVTVMSWGALEYKDGYVASGQLPYLLDNIKWVTDYFINCHPEPNKYYYQVGDGDADHAKWTAAEIVEHIMERPTYELNPSVPGSEVSAETAAAMAAASMLFSESDPVYSATLLQHAIELYDFAETYTGDYPLGAFYKSWSGYNDELVWGAIWLYKATGDASYLAKAEAGYDSMGKEIGTSTPVYKHTFSWDDKAYACYVLLAQLTGKDKYKVDAERYLDHWTYTIDRTPAGLPYQFDNNWGILRYASNTALCALVYSDFTTDATKKQDYYNMAADIVNYALGDNPESLSYVVGYGSDWPKHIHHRTAHGWPDGFPNADVPDNRHILYGALVGGPDFDDNYIDDINQYEYTEVACDYNAAFSGVVARLAADNGGSPLADFPIPEEASQEVFVELKLNVSSENSIELLGWLVNASAWPAIYSENLAFRYYIDITEGIEAGYTAADYSTGGSGTVTGLIPWDVDKNIYYCQATLANKPIYPAGQGEKQEFVSMSIGLPGASGAAWNPDNDWSFAGIVSGSDYVYNQYMPTYENGVHLDGLEPSTVVVPVTGITINPDIFNLCVGETTSITASVLPANATNKSLVYASSNPAVVTISPAGLITAVAEGMATITATTIDGGFTASASVTVSDCVIPVTGISLSETTVTIDEGTNITLFATITPANATDKSVTWTSSNETIATVSASGLVSGLVQGETTITATSSDPAIFATCVVTVKEVISNQKAYPDGIPHAIPGVIEAVNFDIGGEGVAYSDSDLGNNGNGPRPDENVDTEYGIAAGNVGWIAAGEWLEYTVNISETGSYNFEILVASTGNNGAYHIEFNGVDVTGIQTVAATGGWADFVIQKIENISLVAGEQVMRIYMDGSSFNIGTINIALNGECIATAITPYVQINGGAVEQTNIASAQAGDNVLLSPEAGVDGTWSWSGPGGFTATSREVSLTAIQAAQAGNYVVNYTNNCGTISSETFAVSVGTPVDYTLTTDVNGLGSIDLNPVGGVYSSGTKVTATAIAETGWHFVNWTGDASGTNPEVEITMTDNFAITANFEEDGNDPCENPTPISLTFEQNGSGSFCWVTSDDISYINSWNTTKVEINGVDFTNTWANSFPAKINGNYYISYEGSFGWSHFEAISANKRGKISSQNSISNNLSNVVVYPNPAMGEVTVSNIEAATEISVVSMLGKVVYKKKVQNVFEEKISLDYITEGTYLLVVSDNSGKQSKSLLYIK